LIIYEARDFVLHACAAAARRPLPQKAKKERQEKKETGRERTGSVLLDRARPGRMPANLICEDFDLWHARLVLEGMEEPESAGSLCDLAQRVAMGIDSKYIHNDYFMCHLHLDPRML
jgi:hypothetical protein